MLDHFATRRCFPGCSRHRFERRPRTPRVFQQHARLTAAIRPLHFSESPPRRLESARRLGFTSSGIHHSRAADFADNSSLAEHSAGSRHSLV